MITPAIRYISSFQDATNSSSIPVTTPLMVDGRVWDQKNLNVSTYRSGRVIPQVKTGWSTLTTGAWRYYNDNPASATVYGRLYNWYALMGIYDAASLADPSLRDNIAPVDWEVATYGEWITLRNILGRSTAAIALKESGPAHWGPTNTATNSSFFTALPGGYKLYNNNTSFNRLGSVGYWWAKDTPTVKYFYLTNTFNTLGVGNTSTKNWGFSIRLIKPSTIIPNFTTTTPTTINPTSLLGTGGNIPTSYSGTISERGIVYGTSINPTIADAKIEDVTGGTGSYTINITGPLSVNTQYYIRAYAISNIDGLVYAPNISVFTLNATPTVFTGTISQITTNSAESGGYVEDAGGLTLTTKGVCWSTSPDPTIALTTKTSITGSEIGEFVSEITGLVLNTKYYVRAYATNSSSVTGYGLNVEFTTLAVPSLNLIFNQYYAYHAYSLRRLSGTYDYRCVRVRRTTTTPSATTTTVDVFFNSYDEIGLYSDIIYVSGVTTLATNLGEFAASIVQGYSNPDGININQDIFVVTWYDQSGNGKNVTQSTLTQQPRLVFNGNLETSVGKAAVRFIATNSQSLFISDTSVSQTNVSTYVVGNAISSTANTNFFMLNNSNRFYIPALTNIGYQGISTFPVPVTLNTQILYELLAGPLTTSAYSNGIQLAPTSVPSVSSNNLFIRIGLVGTAYTNGYVSEAISFIGTQDRLNIEPNMMDYYGIQRPPLVETANVNYIEPTGTAIGGGNVIDGFGASVTARGVCWSPTENPTIALSTRTLDGSGIGSFTSNLTLLAAYTTYYARAYATSSVTTSYGQQKAFITGQIPVSSFILDLYPASVHHAYSLRRLRYDYTGFCLKIRRTTASPNPVNTITVDLSFDSNGTISFDSLISNQTGATTTAANTLGEFAIGAVDGLTAQSVINVVTWYDQSGNGKNPTIATVGNQPRLVRLDSGVATLETSGGKAAVRFVKASSNVLQLSDTTANINNMSSYFVGQFVTTTASQIGYGLSSTGTNRFYMPFSNGANIFAGYGTSTFAVTLETGTTTTRKLFELLAPLPGSTTLVQGWANGAAKNTATLSSGATVQIQLGTAGSNYYDGYIQEVIGYQSNTNRLEKETNINSYWQIF